ncbi:PTS sugar transporter subunit IIA [Desulfobacterales bacterium HSG17]|nr:PTS sugar transporter subunit IIA [Desulfobacterales bacterium HSG17]
MKLTISEVADSLDLPLSTVKRWVRQGRIPIQKSGNSYVFERFVLEKWAKTHNLLFSPPGTIKNKEKPVKVEEDLLTAMKSGGVFYNIKGDNVEEVLGAAVEAIEDIPDEDTQELHQRELYHQELHQRLIQREQLTSTGIGKGIAIPHPRTPMSDEMENSMIVTCFLEKPINFKAVDNKPVFVIFILLSRNPKSHLHLLSRLSFCVRDDNFISFMKSLPDSDTFLSRIEEIESNLDKKGKL